MAYTLNLTDGTIFATLADGALNTSSALTLVGKNYAGYGEFLNENALKLLENGANTSAPSSPLTGQLWFDKTNGLLKVYNGTVFKNLGAASSSASAPTSNIAGDLWFDSTNSQLYVYDGSAFILVGPSFTSGTGVSGAIVATVTDSISIDHVVTKMYVEDDVVAVFSKDATFTPATGITGFATIGPGLQLSSTISNVVMKGSATNAQLLDNLDSTDFLSAVGNDTTSGTLGVLNDTGIAVGVDSDFRVSVSGADTIIQNQTLNGDITIKVNDGGVTTSVINIDGATSNFNPGSNNAITMGSASLQYAGIYAVNFYGISSSAQYADLAERFHSDQSYPAGTIVELGGVAEITKANDDLSDKVFGVISSRSAYLMNANAGNDLTHPPVAISGRVPVRTICVINKGDRLVAAGNGLARAAGSGEANSFNVIGRALESTMADGESLVEAIVSVH